MADRPEDRQPIETPPSAEQRTHGSVALSDEAFYDADDRGPVIQGRHGTGDEPLIRQAGRADRQEPLVEGDDNEQGPVISGQREISEATPASAPDAFHEADDQGPLVQGHRGNAEPAPPAAAEAFYEADDQGPNVDARARRLEALSHDHLDHAGEVTPGTRREAEVGLGMEEQGRLPAPIRRPMPGEGRYGDFVDGAGQSWDVKRFPSRDILQDEIRANARAAGKPEPTHLTPEYHVKGEFELENAMESIRDDLRSGENVIVDGPSLNADDRRSLEEAIRAEGLEDEVLFYDE
jgi:hypothetical protein